MRPAEAALEASLHRLRAAVDALDSEPRARTHDLEALLDRPPLVLPVASAAPPASRLRVAANAVVGALAVLTTALVLVVAVGPRVLPYQTATVTSAAMAPAIGAGSLVLLSRVDATALAVGDVVTFESPDAPGTLVTRRVDAVEHDADGTWLLTKGDAEDARDPWRVRAVGSGWRSSFVVPAVGHVLTLLGGGPARVLAIAMSVLVFATTAARELQARRRA